MSDVQVSIEDKMAAVYKRILTTVIFICIGWAVIMIGTLGFRSPIAILGFLIAPWPMLGRMLKGGFGAMFNMPEYVVITTHSDGSKSSDGGAESKLMNLFFKCILLAIGVFIGTIATIIYLVILLIQYIALYVQAKPKPVFLRSAFFLFIVAALVLPGSIIAGALVYNAKVKIDGAKFIAEYGYFITAIENADKQNITAYTANLKGQYRSSVLMTILDADNPDDYTKSISKYISIGEAVTIIAPYDRGSVHIRHENDAGTISIRDLSLDPPTP
ncbi:MAG: hypothetical protein LBU88_05925 [Treponema sp.]|nr:hypothetical protein [Treponema sp.]